MKRVLRSCLDPLPRLISLQSLVAVVIMLVAGTGLSVYEYLESAHLPQRNSVHAAAPESAAAPSAYADERSKCSLSADGQRATAPQTRTTEWGISSRVDVRESATASDVTRAPASAFDPCSESAGS